MPNFKLWFSPEPPVLRATGVNEEQLPAALRKLRAAFRQLHMPARQPDPAVNGKRRKTAHSAASSKLETAFRHKQHC